MKKIELKILVTPHKKVDGLILENKLKQKEKNNIANIKRYERKQMERKEKYNGYAWWADFSADVNQYAKTETKIGGLYGRYSIATNGKTKKSQQ